MTRSFRTWLIAIQVCAVMALTRGAHARSLLLWNATASAPIGLYLVRPDPTPSVGDLLVVRPDPALSRWMAARRYIGQGVPLVKRVAAAGEASVCRSGARITIDQRLYALALDRDRLGRPLPNWRGCYRLKVGQVFLLNAAPTWLDGRYFGPTSVTAVIGRASPVWLRSGR